MNGSFIDMATMTRQAWLCWRRSAKIFVKALHCRGWCLAVTALLFSDVVLMIPSFSKLREDGSILHATFEMSRDEIFGGLPWWLERNIDKSVRYLTEAQACFSRPILEKLHLPGSCQIESDKKGLQKLKGRGWIYIRNV